MKPIRIVTALLLAAAWALLSASPASASEETVGTCVVETLEEVGVENFEATVHDGHAEGASEEAKLALEEVETDLERCLEAPNPILPELNEVIWGGLSFFVLLLAMIKWGFPAVRSAMQGRTEKIRNDLQSAQATHDEAAKIKQQHEAALAETKAASARVLDEARQEAAAVKADLQVRAEADIAEMRQRANADVASARQRALADLQGEVSEVIVGAAERVVEQNLDPAAQRQLIENYITSVGSR